MRVRMDECTALDVYCEDGSFGNAASKYLK